LTAHGDSKGDAKSVKATAKKKIHFLFISLPAWFPFEKKGNEGMQKLISLP
jgi:hypothetical protein